MTGLRLAFGMFSVFPVGSAPVDRRTTSRAVLWMPVVGVTVALASTLPTLLLWHGDGHGSALVAAVVVLAGQALLTRGLHLDGLADLADGLGCGRAADGALAVMRQPDIGPFGVAVVVLTLLAQTASLTTVLDRDGVGLGVVAVVTMAATGRLAVVWSAGRRVPAARPDGFGALVAGSLGTPAQVSTTVWVAAAALGAAAIAGASGADVAWLGAAIVGGVLAAWAVRAHAVRRLGGVTGDVFGALVEIATTVALLVLTAESAWR